MRSEYQDVIDKLSSWPSFSQVMGNRSGLDIALQTPAVVCSSALRYKKLNTPLKTQTDEIFTLKPILFPGVSVNIKALWRRCVSKARYLKHPDTTPSTPASPAAFSALPSPPPSQ